MNRLARYFILAALACTAPAMAAEQTNTLVALKARYEAARTRMEKDCDKQKQDALAAYGKALEAGLRTLQGQGDLLGSVAFNSEKARFNKEASVPEAGAPGRHPLLDQAIAGYFAALKKADANKAARAGALAKLYVASLDDLKKALTMQSQFAAAIEVKHEAEAVSALIAAEPARAAATVVQGRPPADVSGTRPAKRFPITALEPVLWLKADAGVVTSGDKVSRWEDQSGKGRHASQSARDLQPTLVAGALNGLPVIRFDGSDGLTLGKLSAAFPKAATLFVVATIDDASYNVFTTANNLSGDYSWWTVDASSRGQPEWNGSYPAVFRSARIEKYNISMPTRGTHVFTVESSSSNWEMWVDGVSGGKVNNSGYYSSGNDCRIGMFDGVTHGGLYESDPDTYLKGDIAEIAASNRVLTPAERKQVEAYLKDRYGLR